MSIRFHHTGFSPVSIKRAFHCFIRSITIILDRGLFHNEQDSIDATTYSQFSKLAGVPPPWNFSFPLAFTRRSEPTMEVLMGFGRGVLLWLLGIPIPIIILLALFWHN